jgi:hypothetical protein
MLSQHMPQRLKHRLGKTLCRGKLNSGLERISVSRSCLAMGVRTFDIVTHSILRECWCWLGYQQPDGEIMVRSFAFATVQWLYMLHMFATCPVAFQFGRSNGRRRRSIGGRNVSLLPKTDSALKVSELHVPGYKTSKLSFILPDDRKALPLHIRTPPPTKALLPFGAGHLLHETAAPIFAREECQRIVDEAEAIAARIAWTTNRHGNFPTTDLPLSDLPETLAFLQVALEERIYPALQSQFGSFLPDPSKLRVADGFVVKYDAAAGQKELKPHRDGSVLSFNIALNPSKEYEGGGTWFASLDQAIKLEQGHMVSHASGLLHGGQGITAGTRYILVSFVILEEYDSWSMRFYNQIRNC